tara:strand:- start:1449 stop:2057 length:609 start_codon:yes stop_codon:yes gene_type:complete
MKFIKAGLLLLLIIILLGIEQSILADVTSSNNTSSNTSTSGNNTSIVGYEQQQTTNYNSGSNPVTNSTSTTQSTTNNNNQTPAAPANAPSTQIYSSQSCTIAYSGAISTVTFGLAGSSYYHDSYCERRLLAQTLNKFGLKIGALSLLCQDPNVRRALYDAASYCPINGKIGKDAKAEWDKLNADVTDQVDQYRVYKESLKND